MTSTSLLALTTYDICGTAQLNPRFDPYVLHIYLNPCICALWTSVQRHLRAVDQEHPIDLSISQAGISTVEAQVFRYSKKIVLLHRPGIEPGASRNLFCRMATANFTTKPPMQLVFLIVRHRLLKNIMPNSCSITFDTSCFTSCFEILPWSLFKTHCLNYLASFDIQAVCVRR